MASAPGKNTRTTKRKKKNRRLRRLVVILLLLAAALLLIVLLVRLRGKVELSSGEVPPSGTTAATAASATEAGTTAPPVTDTSAGTAAKPTTGNGIGAGNSYVQPAGAAWNLVLVNDWNAVPDSYESETEMYGIGDQRLDKRIQSAVSELLAAGSAYNIRVVSGFRDQAHQARLYNNEVQKWVNTGLSQADAQIKAATIVKQPGHSEHNLGLAMDLGGSGNEKLEEDFEETEAFRWLIAHCAEYGFILRFPKDGEDQTGVTYEPWHYRYVGKEAAKEIMERGITLEEYLAEKGL